MMKIIFFCIIILLAGCVVSTGNTPNIRVPLNRITLHSKKDITFSISYYQQIGGIPVAVDERKMIASIKENFSQYNIFNKVHYVSSFTEKSNYHYHFNIIITGTSIEERSNSAGVMILLLGTIPYSIASNIDITMSVWKNNKEIYSITAPERIETWIWLPNIALLPFFNNLTTGWYIRNKVMKYFIGEIIRNNLY